MGRTSLTAAALGALVLLVGCGDAGSPDAGPASPTAPPAVTTPASPVAPTATAPASPAPDEGEPEDEADRPFPADRSADTAPSEGNGLSVVDVRTGRHEGYDRVVFELGGEGVVGWNVEYRDDPRRQGSGHPVELAGGATLSVLLEGLGYPFDTGVEEYDGPRRLEPGLPVVRELEIGGVYEGYFDAFAGVEQERPFRVFRLQDPQRVVLDVQHEG